MESAELEEPDRLAGCLEAVELHRPGDLEWLALRERWPAVGEVRDYLNCPAVYVIFRISGLIIVTERMCIPAERAALDVVRLDWAEKDADCPCFLIASRSLPAEELAL